MQSPLIYFFLIFHDCNGCETLGLGANLTTKGQPRWSCRCRAEPNHSGPKQASKGSHSWRGEGGGGEEEEEESKCVYVRVCVCVVALMFHSGELWID